VRLPFATFRRRIERKIERRGRNYPGLKRLNKALEKACLLTCLNFKEKEREK